MIASSSYRLIIGRITLILSCDIEELVFHSGAGSYVKELHKQIRRFDKCNSHTYLGMCLPPELIFLCGVTLLVMIGRMG